VSLELYLGVTIEQEQPAGVVVSAWAPAFLVD
jgi:hypothetical protein